MNIAIYVDRMEMGGVETHVITQINELLRRGHSVHLSTNIITQDLLNKITTHKRPIGNAFSYFSPWDAGETDLGNFRPDIIHVHPFSSIFRGLRAAERTNASLFVTMHGMYDFGVDRSPMGWLVTMKAKKIIAVDNGVLNLLKKCCGMPEKLEVLYNGIDLKAYLPAVSDRELEEELLINPEWKTLVVVSRMEDGKEIPIIQLMECVHTIAEHVNGLNVVIVGGGAFEFQVTSHNLLERQKCAKLNVICVGRRNDVSRFYSIADLVCGCGRVALEAMACGRPVYSMSQYGFGRIISKLTYETNITGITGYAKRENRKVIKDLVSLLTSDLSFVAQEGYDLVHEYFDINKNTNILENWYVNSL